MLPLSTPSRLAFPLSRRARAASGGSTALSLWACESRRARDHHGAFAVALESLDDEIQSAGGAATLLQLDLKKGDQIDQLGRPSISAGKARHPCANAGILGPLSPLGHIDRRRFPTTIDINLTANWRLIRTLDPLLQRSDAGRAVFLTSGAAQRQVRLLGPIRGLEGRPRSAGEIWAARTDEHQSAPTDQSRRDAHADAGQSVSRRRRRDLARAGRFGAAHSGTLVALCMRNGDIINFRDWRDLGKHGGTSPSAPTTTADL